MTPASQQQPALRGKHRDRFRAEVAKWFVTDRMTVHDIATMTAKRPSVVRRLLNEAGIAEADTQCVGLSEQETAQSLTRRYEAGASITDLVRQTGMDKRVIRRFLVAAGVDLPVAHSVTGEESAQVVARYRAGDSIRTLAGSIGCSYGTIRAALLAAGVQLRPRGATTATAPLVASGSVPAPSQRRPDKTSSGTAVVPAGYANPGRSATGPPIPARPWLDDPGCCHPGPRHARHRGHSASRR
jgi:hypothetical protein